MRVVELGVEEEPEILVALHLLVADLDVQITALYLTNAFQPRAGRLL